MYLAPLFRKTNSIGEETTLLPVKDDSLGLGLVSKPMAAKLSVSYLTY